MCANVYNIMGTKQAQKQQQNQESFMPKWNLCFNQTTNGSSYEETQIETKIRHFYQWMSCSYDAKFNNFFFVLFKKDFYWFLVVIRPQSGWNFATHTPNDNNSISKCLDNCEISLNDCSNLQCTLLLNDSQFVHVFI